jgi:hypothetical protein
LVVLPDANAESTGSRRHLARASGVARQVPVFEMRSVPVCRLTQVTSAGAAVAGEREIGEKVVIARATTEMAESQ